MSNVLIDKAHPTGSKTYLVDVFLVGATGVDGLEKLFFCATATTLDTSLVVFFFCFFFPKSEAGLMLGRKRGSEKSISGMDLRFFLDGFPPVSAANCS